MQFYFMPCFAASLEAQPVGEKHYQFDYLVPRSLLAVGLTRILMQAKFPNDESQNQRRRGGRLEVIWLNALQPKEGSTCPCCMVTDPLQKGTYLILLSEDAPPCLLSFFRKGL